jgi:hypothetical protein
VLLSIEEYRRLTNSGPSIVDLLAMPGAEDIEIDIPRRDEHPRVPDLG